MPYAPASPCAEPGCPRLVHGARCEEHEREQRRHYAARPDRKEAKRFYASARWQRVRRIKLSEEPFCQEEGCDELAVDVHHIKPWQEFPDMTFTMENLESLCKSCHNGKRPKRGEGQARM